MSELLAPNGKPSNLTAEQYKLVRSSAFKKWFGDWEKSPKTASKVVDENGEPKIIYHKTPNEFYEFLNDKYIWTSDSLTYQNKMEIKRFQNTLELFGDGRNILDLTPLGTHKNIDVLKEFFLDKGIRLSLNRSTGTYALFTFNYITKKQLKDNGYDCVKVVLSKDFNLELMRIEKEYIGYIFLDSNQVKLADGTNTTFDGSNPDIRFKDGGEVNTGLFSQIWGWFGIKF